MRQIIDFIDNKDFANANADKKFTVEEQVALVVHNDSVSLEEKYEFLQSLDYSNNNTLEKQVKEWIDLQKEKINYIYNLKEEDVVFVINYPDSPSLSRVFTKFEKIHIDKHVINKGVNIDKINCKEDIGQIGKINFNKDGEISSCFIVDKNNSKLADIKSPLTNIKVSLNNPYKPFDIIKVPLYCRYLIVANNSALTDDVIEKENHKGKLTNGWLSTNIPCYAFPTHWDSGSEINVSVFNNTRLPLSMINKVAEGDLTMYQVEYVKKVKQQIKKQMGYIK